MKNSHTSLSSQLYARFSRNFSGLLNLLGIVFVISGIIGLFFIQSPLKKSTETRSDAASAQGPVETSFNPRPGTTLTYDNSTQAPLKLDFSINTNQRQVQTIQYVFNIVTQVVPETPEILLNPEIGFTSSRAEIQRVGDGYLVSINLVPKDGQSAISTRDFNKLFTLSFKPSTNGNVTLSFDQQNSFASMIQGNAVVDGLQTLPVLSYPILIAQPVPVAGYAPQWATPHVTLNAANFNIKANGQTFLPTGQLYITSDPPSDPTDDYTTFEVTWTSSDGTEMRMYMYIYKDDTRWTVEEMRIYNGKKPGDWIYFTPPIIATGPKAGQKITAPLGQPFSVTGDLVFKSSRNGEGEVFFNNLNLHAFLPTDDLFFEGSLPWKISYKTTEGQAVEPEALEPGKTYLATSEFAVNNKNFKGSLKNQENVTVRVNVSGQTSATKDVPVSYNLIANNAQGASAMAKDISFKAGETNSVSTIIDPENKYPELNENNNFHAVSFNYQGTGGTTYKQCNAVCSTNEQCGPNHRCYDTGTDKRCRLVTNVSSEGCQAPTPGSKSCNQTCNNSSECSGNLTCWSGVCRNPNNAGSTSCADPATSAQAATIKSCNQNCSSNADCAVNLRCYEGACRLATNVSSSTCAAATTSTITDYYSQTADQKGGNDADAGPLDESVLPTDDESSQTATDAASTDVIMSPPPLDFEVSTTPAPEQPAEPALTEKLKTFFGETGKLASTVIGIGIALLLLSILWAIFGGKRRNPPAPPTPERPKENEVAPKPPMPQKSSESALKPPITLPTSQSAQMSNMGSAVVPRFTPPQSITLPPTPASAPMSAKPPTPSIPPAPSATPPVSTAPSTPPPTPAPSSSSSSSSSSSMIDRIKQKGVGI